MKCFSQTETIVDSSNEYYNHAIQFYIVNQVIVAYKYHFTEYSALRFTINATGLFSDEDMDIREFRELTTDTLTYYVDEKTIISDQFFELKAQYLYHFEIHNIVRLFLGCGPFVNYSFEQYERQTEAYYKNSNEIHSNYYKINENIWNVGISILAGLEVIVYKNISFFTEYEATIYRGWHNIDNYRAINYHSDENYSINSWGYNLEGLRIGIGIYF